MMRILIITTLLLLSSASSASARLSLLRSGAPVHSQRRTATQSEFIRSLRQEDSAA
jgi:hypothetical protein